MFKRIVFSPRTGILFLFAKIATRKPAVHWKLVILLLWFLPTKAKLVAKVEITNQLLNRMPSKKLIEEVWEKGKEIRGRDPDVWRKDKYDNKIRFGSYGTEGEYGWEIDHKNPKDKGGSDQLRNLQPLHWEENREKGAKTQHKGK